MDTSHATSSAAATPSSTESGLPPHRHIERESLIPRRWLGPARAAWVGTVIVALIIFGANLSERYAGLVHVASGFSRADFASLGLSPSSFATIGILLEVGFALGFFAVALVIFARRAGNRGALLFSLLLIAFGVGLPGTTYALLVEQPIWKLPGSVLQIAGWMALLLFGFLFPNARFTPRWTRLLAVVWLAWVIAFFTLADRVFAGRPLLVATSFLIWAGWFSIGAYAQVYRYTFAATPNQRQQTKWVVFGFVLAVLIAGLAVVPHILTLSFSLSGFATPPLRLASALVLSLGVQIIPITIGIAVLRHQLFDIDLLINRALVYGLLTGALIALYFCGVFLLQLAFRGLTNQSSSAAIALSTLGIAALFNPLRTRIQSGIDRRFYRRKYDAARIIEEFAASLPSEVDLNHLIDHLIAVAAETMEPAHISFWVRPPSNESRQPAHLSGEQ